MSSFMIVDFLAATVQAGTPLLLAASGEMMAERSGIMNLGVEGMMLVGAVSGYLVTVLSGNHWLGVVGALGAGALMALIHAFISITLRGNQVVSGLALTIFGSGLSSFLGKNFVGTPLHPRFEAIPIPGLAKIPVLGPILFKQDALIYLSFLLVVLLYLILFRTSWGLALRVTGEAPAAADASGINITRIRYLNTVLGGALAGLGGAYLSLVYAPSWIEGMTAGRGWIAVALVIFGMWSPIKVMAGAYLFGGVEALTFRLQTMGVTVSPFFLQMLPYVLTIVVLVLAVQRNRQEAGPPAALGIPYDREER
ncbi:MAG TPA: ABC transporter permease [Syntrophomonadaceae bacterium]|nr:ABC transporter permease [Syntrophomonadaceae bacterium]